MSMAPNTMLHLSCALRTCHHYMPPLEVVLSHLKNIERRVVEEEAGYVVEVEQDEVEKYDEERYIPHHIVQHIGKNQVVYNCFFQYKGHNRNVLLLPGPTLGSSLLAVLPRFYEHHLAFSSDIRGVGSSGAGCIVPDTNKGNCTTLVGQKKSGSSVEDLPFSWLAWEAELEPAEGCPGVTPALR